MEEVTMTKYLRKISTPSKVDSTQIIDSLNSTSKTDALSADAGRRLNEKINSLDEYSEEEKRIGTWFGKPFYRKSLNIGTVSTQKSIINHNIENFGDIVFAFGSYRRNGTETQNLILGNYTSWETWLYDFNLTTFVLYFSNNQWNAGANNIKITLFYTKTTDELSQESMTE
jgi:hypothetical protein